MCIRDSDHIRSGYRRGDPKGDGYSDEIAKRQYLADLLDRRYVQPCRICLSRLYDWLGRAVNESYT